MAGAEDPDETRLRGRLIEEEEEEAVERRLEEGWIDWLEATEDKMMATENNHNMKTS